MLDLGWMEMAVIVIIALLVVGPRELPRVIRSVNEWLGKARSMAREFKSGLDDIANQMRHHGPTLTVYLLGTLGVAYHLANGLHSFAMGWGLVVSRRALRKLDGVAVAIFLALLAMSWSAIYALWAAGA